MPSTLSYPGVYVEEIPSGVRTITGVATSITAFVGRALCGPVNVATTLNGYADFERIFGGLWTESALGFAVRDFYLNGGQKAVIVRLYHAETGDGAKPAKAAVSVGELKFEAADEGSWGKNLRVRVDLAVAEDKATSMGLKKEDLFNLAVSDASDGTTERFLNLSVKDSPRRVDKVLAAESRLLRWKGDWKSDTLPALPTAAAGDPISAAEDALATARTNLEQAQRTNPSADHTAEQNAVTTAQTAVATAKTALANSVSDGLALDLSDFDPPNGQKNKKGLYALEQADLFNLLCLPPYKNGDVDVALVSKAAAYCEARRAMLLVDSPSDWKDKTTAVTKFSDAATDYVGTRSKNAALFFPRLRQPNPLRDNQPEDFAPSGTVAGVFARTDTERGVWKAPAGLEATVRGVPQLSVNLTDLENGELNPLGVNCLRAMPGAGRVIWGSRTLQGNDRLASEWKYIPVRRLALYIEESLYRGTQWVVFEPNDEPLWAQIRLNVGAFMHALFRQGAFQGRAPKDAYFVKCDRETTPQDQINLGIVNIVVGFAPLKPAEFVVLKIQQMAGQIET